MTQVRVSGTRKLLGLERRRPHMTTIGFGAATRYALRLYAYVLAAVVVGGVGVALGAALVYPELRAWRGPGDATVAPGVGGGLLLVLGLSVLAVGWLGTAYKLLADGVAAGGASTPDSVDGGPGQPGAHRPDGSTATPDPGAGGQATDGANSGEQPPEPSPAEIAFGEDVPAGGEGRLPGDDGVGDPLGDRTE